MSPPESRPNCALNSRRQLRYQLKRALLFVMLQITHLEKCIGPDHRADRHGIVAIEHLHRLERRQIGVDLRLVRHVHAIVSVGQDEAVDAHHHRARQLLGQPERLDVQVRRFLVGFGVQLDPARVAHRHAVGMIVPDVDRRADRAVADGHDDRQPEARRVIDRFRHEQDALARGGGVAARAGGRCADGHRQRGKFGFDVDELAILELAVLHHLAQAFDDMRLRRDRISANHFRPAQGDRLRDGERAFHLLKHGLLLR